MGAGQERGAFQKPVFVFLGSERVEIEQHIPVGHLAAEAFERAAPRQTPRGCAASCQRLNSFPPAREGYGMLSGRSRIALSGVAVGGRVTFAERLQRRGILRLDPVERAHPLDLFEPQVGIVVGRVERRTRIGCGHGRDSRREPPTITRRCSFKECISWGPGRLVKPGDDKREAADQIATHPSGGFLPGWIVPHFGQVRAFWSL